jgi:hypothetical protein
MTDRRRAAGVAFAADRPVVAILETFREGNQMKSVLGFWDLSALAK